ncbi:MAG: glycoside hydrolase family 3 C-terminal domain-containing protein [Faecalibacterium sp.]|jgi:beta-glucosidase|nr:glycoside hydrolase family 3 C-terminal domain-containing protein [Faecalibacterium sp.]
MELRDNSKKQKEYRARAAALVAQMTPEEKAGQLMYDAPAVERLGIPSYNWWGEALHGVARAGTATVFPQAIALAAMFDENRMEQVADAVSTEARAKYNAAQAAGDHDIYKSLTFWTPNVNIFRDPRWGRGHETYGEDPYLTSRLGVRFVEGLQGHDPNYLKTAACAKHFAAHSGPEAERHHFDAKVSEQDLRATYLPAFQACVQEGNAEIVMGAYSCLNGTLNCANAHMIEDVLRKEWGFEGHFTSDFGAICDFHSGHRKTKTPEESVELALENGCDLIADMYYTKPEAQAELAEAIRSKKNLQARVDNALTNLFTTRMKLGMFDAAEENPYAAIPYTIVDSAKMCRMNEEISERCAVLLKNDGILPLQKKALHTIGVVGPNADSRRALVGNYEGTASRYVTVLEGIQDAVGGEARVLYSQGCDLFKDRTSNLTRPNDRASEVKAVCAESDVVIAVMGLDADLEGEEGDVGNEFASGDKPNLNLPGLQSETLRVIAESGKPCVLVMLSGSAMALGWEEEHLNAILQGWYPGAQGGRAIARLLFGEANPQGRLPITFYRTSEELPAFTDYAMQGRTYRYMKQAALFPFGYGLSYTSYVYSGAALSAEKLDAENGIDISARVKNAGKMAGTETAEVYVKAPGDAVPHAQLKGIAKVELVPGEEKTVTIHLPAKAFLSVEADGKALLHHGTYQISIGGSQPEPRSETLNGHTVAVLTAEY